MSSIKMVALRKHPFGTGEREAGEEYTATADEAAILIALKWAKKAPEPKPQEPAKAEAVPAAKAATGKALEADATDAKRTYERRDMKAKR